jgi:uncharacterized protein involved in response to NO
MMQISEPDKQPVGQFALFALGFRPFFLLAGVSGLMLLAYWVLAYSNGWQVTEHLPASYWHSHEMIFGYSAAVIAGFLLTAVRNWTGVTTLKGAPLIILASLWLLARILPFASIELFWFSLVDMAFLPLLAMAIAYPVIKVKQWKNLFFVPLLLLYAMANGFFHAEVVFSIEGAEETGMHGGLGVIIMIITIMAGRVIGFFIERGLANKVKTYQWAEQLALWGTALFMAGQFFLPKPVLTVIAVVAAIGHLARLVGWHNPEIWRVPLLWVLYLGYTWLFSGFVLSAMELNGLIAETLAIHAFTTGAIGVMTLGMMARVALGHTGRALQSNIAMSWAFVLINLAVVVRVFFPVFAMHRYLDWIQLAGLMWTLAFVIFSLVYMPILIRPRVDGTPG